MNENQVEELIKTEPPVIDASSDTSLDDNTHPDTTTPIEPAKPKKNNKPLIIVLVILLLAALGAVIYFLLSQPKPDNSQTKIDTSETEKEPEEEKEIEITDNATISALYDRLFGLHRPITSQSELSSDNLNKTYQKNASFSFVPGYNVSDSIYPDASNFGISEKLFVVTSVMRRDKETQPLSELGITENLYLEPDSYCEQNINDCNQAFNTAFGISKEAVEAKYESYFGEKPEALVELPKICGRMAYSEKYEIYYDEFIGGCGGFGGHPHQLYITSYAQKGDEYYIYARLNTTILEGAGAIYGDIYKVFLSRSELYDDSGQPVTPSETLLYAKNVAENEMHITEENYEEFESYRFVFGKNDDNYYFKTVEKL